MKLFFIIFLYSNYSMGMEQPEYIFWAQTTNNTNNQQNYIPIREEQIAFLSNNFEKELLELQATRSTTFMPTFIKTLRFYEELLQYPECHTSQAFKCAIEKLDILYQRNSEWNKDTEKYLPLEYTIKKCEEKLLFLIGFQVTRSTLFIPEFINTLCSYEQLSKNPNNDKKTIMNAMNRAQILLQLRNQLSEEYTVNDV